MPLLDKMGQKVSDYLGSISVIYLPEKPKSTQTAHKFVLFAKTRFHCRKNNTPKGSRTPVFGLRTRCPRPLDDGGVAEQCDSSGQH